MFQVVDQAPPGCLSILGESQGPLVDTGVHYHSRNGFLLVSRIEAGEIGRHFGLVEPEVWEQTVEKLEGELREARRQIEFLTENLSVPLAEVIDLVAERAKRRPELPAGEVA